MTARFQPQEHPGDRILLTCGRVDFGAVFPPAGTPPGRHPWVWRLWIGGVTDTRQGRAATELAARSALMAAFRDWLRKAELVEVGEE
ncbi:MAG TPA: hypothetical protein PKD10_16115 [Paracoccaceae bacterium]|nr:hypothetical protein [Paracoccaceae bacterium]HMO73632.1 hypothetical protein [Paracoccaceae bacterium]